MEEQAFRQAVEDHRDVVFRIALTYLRDRADADDVAQDVFLKLLKSEAYRTKCVSTLGASAQVDAPFSAV